MTSEEKNIRYLIRTGRNNVQRLGKPIGQTQRLGLTGVVPCGIK